MCVRTCMCVYVCTYYVHTYVCTYLYIYLFTYYLLKGAVANSDDTASSDTMVSVYYMKKHVEINDLDLIWGAINTSARRDHGKHKPQPQYSVPGQCLNPGRVEFKAAVTLPNTPVKWLAITTWPGCSQELPRDLGVSIRGPYTLRLTEVQLPNMLDVNKSHSGSIFVNGNRSLSITIDYYPRLHCFGAEACE